MFPLEHPDLLLEAKFFPVLSLRGGDREAVLGQAEGGLSSQARLPALCEQAEPLPPV